MLHNGEKYFGYSSQNAMFFYAIGFVILLYCCKYVIYLQFIMLDLEKNSANAAHPIIKFTRISY